MTFVNYVHCVIWLQICVCFTICKVMDSTFDWLAPFLTDTWYL